MYLNNSDSDESKVRKINANLDELRILESRLTKGLIELPTSGSSTPTSATWGSIGGALSDQKDLMSELESKVPVIDAISKSVLDNLLS